MMTGLCLMFDLDMCFEALRGVSVVAADMTEVVVVVVLLVVPLQHNLARGQVTAGLTSVANSLVFGLNMVLEVG